jgi:hypothetical protein
MSPDPTVIPVPYLDEALAMRIRSGEIQGVIVNGVGTRSCVLANGDIRIPVHLCLLVVVEHMEPGELRRVMSSCGFTNMTLNEIGDFRDWVRSVCPVNAIAVTFTLDKAAAQGQLDLLAEAKS